MNQSNILYEDFDNICRLCLCATELKSIFSNPKLITTFKYITNVKIKENDKLPKNICTNCIQKLEDLSSFIETCKNNDALLKSIIFQKEDESLVSQKSELIDSTLEIDSVEEIHVKVEGNENEEDNIITLKIVKEAKPNDENKVKTKNKIGKHFLKSNKIFPCKQCNKKFCKLTHLKLHVYSHKRCIKALCCEKCNTQFLTVSALARHSCLVSKKLFKSTNGKKEENGKKRNDMCLCMYCNKFLTRKSDLQRHLCTHTGIKAFNCDVCRKKFSQKSALVRHSFLHTEKFKCDDCGKPFTRDSQLQNHIKKQHDIKNKSGMNSTCLYKFKSKSCIEDHLKLMNKSDFKCVICNKVFASKGSLYCHYLSPTQIKEVKCDKCEGEFSLNSLLIQHKLSKEGNLVEKFEPTCPECGNDFLISSLIQHNPNKIKIHKPKLKSASAAQGFNCSYCGKIFSYKCNLKVHLSTHTGARFSCELCKNSYSTKESLKHHILAHKGETPCTCPYCGKQFRKPSYYKHLLIHKGERRYECNICKKGFIRKDQLNQHLRVHKT